MIKPMKETLLVKLILDGIDRDRRGESVNQTRVLHGVINSLVDMADRQKTLEVVYE